MKHEDDDLARGVTQAESSLLQSAAATDAGRPQDRAEPIRVTEQRLLARFDELLSHYNAQVDDFCDVLAGRWREEAAGCVDVKAKASMLRAAEWLEHAGDAHLMARLHLKGLAPTERG